jgi:hypothetical protein
MNLYDDAPVEVVTQVSLAAALGTVVVDWPDPIPAGDELSEILSATVWHDDVNPLAGRWWFNDAGGNVQCGDDVAAVAANIRVPLYRASFPQVITMAAFVNGLHYTVDAGAADGTILTIELVRRVVRGVR